MRISAVEKLPNPIRLEIEKRIRAGETRLSIALWSTGEGHDLTERAVRIHAEKINDRRDKARDQAELTVAIDEAVQVSGVVFSIGLIDRLELLYSQALMEIQPADLISGMRLVDVLAAANRFAAVKIQEEAFKIKWSQEMAAKMSGLKGKPGLSDDVIRQMQGELFGIYEDEADS